MQQNNNLNCAGNLLEEMEELKQLLPGDSNVEMADTYTRDCAAFLTIYCC